MDSMQSSHILNRPNYCPKQRNNNQRYLAMNRRNRLSGSYERPETERDMKRPQPDRWGWFTQTTPEWVLITTNDTDRLRVTHWFSVSTEETGQEKELIPLSETRISSFLSHPILTFWHCWCITLLSRLPAVLNSLDIVWLSPVHLHS